MNIDQLDQKIMELTAHIEGFDKSQDTLLWAKMFHNRANMMRDRPF